MSKPIFTLNLEIKSDKVFLIKSFLEDFASEENFYPMKDALDKEKIVTTEFSQIGISLTATLKVENEDLK